MEAISIGLTEGFDEHHLDYRIRSTQFPGDHLQKLGVSLMRPIGGHAEYVDATRLYPPVPLHEYLGHAPVCARYELAGIRCVDLGSVMFATYDAAGALVPAAMELLRLAIPRRVYTQSHIECIAEPFEEVIAQRTRARGVRIVSEPRFLRHFCAHFAPIG